MEYPPVTKYRRGRKKHQTFVDRFPVWFHHGFSTFFLNVGCLWDKPMGKSYCMVGMDQLVDYYRIPSGKHTVCISLLWKPWPIEIDGLPMKNGDFRWRTVTVVITRGYHSRDEALNTAYVGMDQDL